MKAKFKKIYNVLSEVEDFEDEDTPITKEELKKMSRSTIKSCLLYVLCIVGLAWLLAFIIAKSDSCESEVKDQWTTVNIHDCFSIDIPPMLEIVKGWVSKSGIVRGVWDEEASFFRLIFRTKSMFETTDASSPYAVVYIAYDINPFECEFGEEEVKSDVSEDVVYENFIKPDFNAVPDYRLSIVGTPKFGYRVINGRTLFVVEYTRRLTDDEEYPPVKTQISCCGSTNGSKFLITVACDSEELMDDMMKIIETIEIP